MEIKSETLDLATLFFDSWQFREDLLPKDFKEFVIQTSLDSSLEIVNNYEDNEHLREEWNEVYKDNPAAWTLLYLFHKGYINKKEVKSIIQDKIWMTSCGGDWQDKLIKEFKVKINPKD